jgi:glycosyltransferase involved in cell wall biosynthesis
MKRILFIPGNCVPFHGKTLENRPLGGTETGVIRLANALQKFDIDVVVASEFDNPPLTDPLFVPIYSIPLAGEFDAIIGVRDWQTLLLNVKAKQKFLWTGDAFDQPSTVGLGDKRIIQLIDKLLCVSEWQKKTLSNASGFNPEKIIVIRNGVDLNLFEKYKNTKRIRHRLIYSSTPYRGLKYLLSIFPQIKSQVPSATLVICSGYDVYKGSSPIPKDELDQFNAMIDKFLDIDGVIVRGNVTQDELAYEMSRSSILAYPNIFAETSCITVLEAKAAGLVTVSSNLGALPETVGKAGILIDKNPSSQDYLNDFTNECIRLLNDDLYWQSYSKNALNEVQEQSWDQVAKNVISLI